MNRMCAASCDFVKRHFFSDYLMGFINSGILKVDVDCCEKDLCNGGAGAGGQPLGPGRGAPAQPGARPPRGWALRSSLPKGF